MSDALDKFLYHMDFDPDKKYDWQVQYLDADTHQLYLLEYQHNLLESESINVISKNVKTLLTTHKRDIITNIVRRTIQTEPVFNLIAKLVPKNLKTYKIVQFCINKNGNANILAEDKDA